MYHLLGTNLAQAIKPMAPGQRAEAIKVLTGIAATHMAMAGALGLPLEPIKYLLLATQGVTGIGWGEVEDEARQIAAHLFGKTGGEVVTKGLPRLLQVDLSSRVGLDSLTSFGEPRSSKDSDVKSWLFDTIAGAPASLAADWVRGGNALLTGDFTKAAELMVPMKFASDAIKTYRVATEGKLSAQTGKQTMEPYSVGEAVSRVAGFTPRREAETSAARAAFYSRQATGKGERASLTAKWLNAAPTDKRSVWAEIVEYNKSKPKDERLTMADLTRAAKRAKLDKRRELLPGVSHNKRDRRAAEESPYNVQP
jgi:hypothetical protein